MTRNDAEEFAEFVRATGPRLHRAALLLTGDHHLTEDLTQSTYARVYASWRRVSRADDPFAYARRTLLNTYFSHRRLRRNSELPADPHLGSEPATRRSVPAVDPTTRLDLLDALAALSPHDRAVLVLRYWEDRSVADTAHDLGISETAVRTRSRRALQRLRPLLDADLTERTSS
ncbi:SigE family RNA polymerase sigma factor [Nocardioides sp. LMS-CY]|uniref:RNA polymerase sigma-70 factor (Sigma-E family) n=1 Tax=Nocardioides soli TaxID=1036020 RepID=A0A7W4Z419_9ACTN|nr:SigE family RNA polymerase sigma factor [Nocardioides sp. LMS-CY]MBB3044416.1 RNA polymerase sigma-70 factor (sigma-E family) [Nocardioides soli]QWF20281.1 SigE family RNA polymerase sigma factor [Nocardioides sp. LMS-CY]